MSILDTLQSSILNYSELIGHPPEFNIPLQWAHWTPSGVQYSTPVSPSDTLWSSTFNYSELIGHPSEFNIHQTLLYSWWVPSTLASNVLSAACNGILIPLEFFPTGCLPDGQQPLTVAMMLPVDLANLHHLGWSVLRWVIWTASDWAESTCSVTLFEICHMSLAGMCSLDHVSQFLNWLKIPIYSNFLGALCHHCALPLLVLPRHG